MENIPLHAEGSRGINFNPYSSVEPQNQVQTPNTPTYNVFEQLLTPPAEFRNPTNKMSEVEAKPEERRGSDLGSDNETDLKSSFVSTRKSRKYPDPPVIYPDVDVRIITSNN